jgi:hypothetical protein
MANGKRKGNNFERGICTKLSEWWSHGRRDDIFWRSHSSGGRATVRQKAGRGTKGQHGDVAPTDPIGDPLLDLMVIELKKGYSKHTLADLVDRQGNSKQQQWEEWIDKVITSCENAGSFSWAIIAERDRRAPLSVFPRLLMLEFKSIGAIRVQPTPYITISTFLRRKHKKDRIVEVVGMNFNHFCTAVSPDHIRAMVKVL